MMQIILKIRNIESTIVQRKHDAQFYITQKAVMNNYKQ